MRHVLAALALVCAAYSVADACKCAAPSISSAATQAKTVFVATITEVHEDKRCHPKHPTWCSSTFTYDATVDGVFKGKAATTVVLDAGGGHGDCSHGSLGRKAVGARWLVFTSSETGPFRVRLCSGTQRATASAIGAVTKLLGAPRDP